MRHSSHCIRWALAVCLCTACGQIVVVGDRGDTGARETTGVDTTDAGVETSAHDGEIETEAGCVADVVAWPPAAGCPDTQWACWKVPPDSPGSSNYQLLTICGDKVVVDKTTQLMWSQDEEIDSDSGDHGLYTWDAAKARCASSRRAGFSDWRLPWRIEAVSIVDYAATSAPALDPIFSTATKGVWSSSPALAGTSGCSGCSSAWFIAFDGGVAQIPTTSVAGVRCVR